MPAALSCRTGMKVGTVDRQPCPITVLKCQWSLPGGDSRGNGHNMYFKTPAHCIYLWLVCSPIGDQIFRCVCWPIVSPAQVSEAQQTFPVISQHSLSLFSLQGQSDLVVFTAHKGNGYNIWEQGDAWLKETRKSQETGREMPSGKQQLLCSSHAFSQRIVC